jgi:hypothetical protein
MAQVYPEDRGTNYAIREGRAVGRLVAAEAQRERRREERRTEARVGERRHGMRRHAAAVSLR